MSFRRDIEEWVAKQVARRSLTVELRRLLRGTETGLLNPEKRFGLPGEPGEIRVAFPGVPETTVIPTAPGTFIYYPNSDAASYGWGIPYTDQNRPLGTPLASGNQNDATFLQYRALVSPDTVNHEQEWLGGARWKRGADRTLSWGPVSGWGPAALPGTLNYPIYHKGYVITSRSEQVLAANTDGTHLYVIIIAGFNDIKILRQEVLDWDTVPATLNPVWEESDLIYIQYANRIENSGQIDINASCDEACVVILYNSSLTSRAYEYQVAWDKTTLIGQATQIANSPQTEDKVTTDNSQYIGTPGPCIADPDPDGCFPHCYQLSYETPLASRSDVYDYKQAASLTAVVGVYYQDQTDEIVRTELFIEMANTHTGSRNENFSWEHPPDEAWIGTGYSRNSDETDSDHTDVVMKKNGSEVGRWRIYEESERKEIQYAHDYGIVEEPCSVSPYPDGYEIVTTVNETSSVAFNRYGFHNPRPGEYRQEITITRDNSTSNGTDPFCTSGGHLDCDYDFNQHENTNDSSTDRYINDIITHLDGSVVLDNNVQVPEFVIPVPTNFDLSDANWLNTLRQILYRCMVDVYGSSSQYTKVLFANGHTVGTLFANVSDTTDTDIIAFWNGGDLPALTQMVGNNQNVSGWNGLTYMGVVE